MGTSIGSSRRRDGRFDAYVPQGWPTEGHEQGPPWQNAPCVSIPATRCYYLTELIDSKLRFNVAFDVLDNLIILRAVNPL